MTGAIHNRGDVGGYHPIPSVALEFGAAVFNSALAAHHHVKRIGQRCSFDLRDVGRVDLNEIEAGQVATLFASIVGGR